MTIEEKYTELLKELAELLKSKNDKIAVQECVIEGLERKLAGAEEQIKTLKGSIEMKHQRIEHHNDYDIITTVDDSGYYESFIKYKDGAENV